MWPYMTTNGFYRIICPFGPVWAYRPCVGLCGAEYPQICVQDASARRAGLATNTVARTRTNAQLGQVPTQVL